MPLFYADASALVKLVLDEPESESLARFLGDADLVSSELVLTEVPRAVRRAAHVEPVLPRSALLEQTDDLLGTVALLPLDTMILTRAGSIREPLLRALDAIHVAAASEVAPVDAFLTYDERQGAAARLVGLRTVSPGRS